MKGRDFIFTGQQPWDISIGSNAIDMAKQVALNNRVLYVDSALDQMTILRNESRPENKQRLEVLRKKKEPLRQISNTLWVLDFPFSVMSTNQIPDGFIFDFFNKLNNKKMFSYIKKIADQLGFKNIIHFMDNDIYRSFYSKELLKPVLSIYYRRDNLLPFSYWKNHAPRLEPLIIKKSDLVICNSPQLAEFAHQFNEKSYSIGQGLDLSAYDPEIYQETPKEIDLIPKPRIGYIGDINSLRLDPNLIYELAKSKPDYSFIMIGSEDKIFAAHALHKLKNVFFLGSISKPMVPAYMSTFQVCLNPQVLNEITNGNYPRKVDEYLAMGKPVIATKTATMDLFKDHVYLCSSLAEYQEALEKALIDTDAERTKQRIIFAQSHSWENNVNCLYKHIEEYLN